MNLKQNVIEKYKLRVLSVTRGAVPSDSGVYVKLRKLSSDRYEMYLSGKNDDERAFRHTIRMEYANIFGLDGCSMYDFIGSEGTFRKWGYDCYELESKGKRLLISANGEEVIPVVYSSAHKIVLNESKDYFLHSYNEGDIFKDKVRHFLDRGVSCGVESDSDIKFFSSNILDIIYKLTKKVLQRERLPKDYTFRVHNGSGLSVVDIFLEDRTDDCSPFIRYVFEGEDAFTNVCILGDGSDMLHGAVIEFMSTGYKMKDPIGYIEHGGYSGLIYRIKSFLC